MKKVIAILAVGFLFTAFGFVSDSNPAPNDDIANVMVDDFNYDVACDVESVSKVFVVKATRSNAPVTAPSMIAVVQKDEIEVAKTLDGRQTNRRNYHTMTKALEPQTTRKTPYNFLC